MHTQCAHIRTVLRHFTDGGGKGAVVPLAAGAYDRIDAVFDHLEAHRRHIEYLTAFQHSACSTGNALRQRLQCDGG